MYHICRTCFEIIREDVKFYNLENPGSEDIVTQLESCIPQLTLNIVKNPVICSSCVETLKVSYNFKVKCLHTEERIYNYIFERKPSDKEIIDIGSVINYEIQNKFNSIDRGNSSSVNYEIQNKFSSMNCDNSSVLTKNQFCVQTSSGTERDYECGLLSEIGEIEKHETEDLAQSLFDEDVMHQDFPAKLGEIFTEGNTNCTPLEIKSEDKNNDLIHNSIDRDNSSVLIKNEFCEQTSSGTERDYECGLFSEIDEIEKHETEDLAQSLFDEDVMHQDFPAELGEISTEGNTDCTPLEIKSKDKNNDLIHSFSKTVENINRNDSDIQGFDTLNYLGRKTDLVKDNITNDALFKLEKQCKLLSGCNQDTKVIGKDISMPHCTTVLNNVVNTFHMSLRKSTSEPKYSLGPRTNNKHCDNDSSFETESNTVTDKTASIKKNDKNSIITLYSCDQCEYSAFSKRKLQLHQFTHTEGKHFKCKQCNYSTVWKYCLELHIIKHHNKKPFKCTKCKYITPVKLKLDLHIKKNQCKNPDKNKLFKCQHCKFSGISKSALQLHELKHTGEKPFVCSNCDFRSANKYFLKQHILNTHSNNKHCDNGSSFKTESNTVTDKTASIKKIDKNSIFSLYSCDQCEYSAFSKRKLQLHQFTHTEGKHFKCKQCKYSTVWKSCLELHMIKHHNKKPFKCTKCKYITPVKLKLDLHIKKNQCKNPDKNKLFKCQHCKFSGISKSALQRHELKHTGEKPFVCSKCDFRSASKYFLKRHILNTHFEKRKTC